MNHFYIDDVKQKNVCEGWNKHSSIPRSKVCGSHVEEDQKVGTESKWSKFKVQQLWIHLCQSSCTSYLLDGWMT